MLYKCVILIFVIAFLSAAGGCASDKESKSSAVGRADVSCPSDKSLVYLYRVQHDVFPTFLYSNGIKMYVNEIGWITLSPREYSSLVLTPGPTIFSHEVPQGSHATERIILHDLQLQLEPGKTYYISYRDPVNTFQKHKPIMSLVDEATATNEISHCKFRGALQ